MSVEVGSVMDFVNKKCQDLKIWTENIAPFYDLMMTHTLESPSFTVQWLPEVIRPEDKDYSEHHLIVGTNTYDECNHILIVSAQIPNQDLSEHGKPSHHLRNNGDFVFRKFGSVPGKIKIERKIQLEGRVNRARYMPQNTSLVATKTSSADVLVLNHTQSNPPLDPDDKCQPYLRLRGHTEEGYGLAWNPNVTGHLLSASYDQTICLWDINAAPTTGGQQESCAIDPTNMFTCHAAAVNDVAWHCSKNVFGSVADDGKLMIWDIRTNTRRKPNLPVDAHSAKVSSLSFNSLSEFSLATGSADKTVGLWDLRYLKLKFDSLESHQGEVLQVQWSPHSGSILASSATDGCVHVWDRSRIHCKNDLEKLGEVPSERIHSHEGHYAKIPDFAWNQNEHWLICSMSENCFMHVWQMSENVYADVEYDETDGEFETLRYT